MRPRRMAPLKPVALSELGGTDGASASLDEAARVDAAGITSPTFKKHYKTRLAHALIAGADDITKKRIENEIAAGVESEVEMHEILAEHVAAGEMPEEPDDVEGDATGRAAE